MYSVSFLLYVNDSDFQFLTYGLSPDVGSDGIFYPENICCVHFAKISQISNQTTA